jgi:ATP-dependent helicase/nuclease subunit A
MIDWKPEQKRAIEEQGNLLVSASAGSGKTTVMIERVMRLIKGGVDLHRLLIITFTRAAAADIREKIVDGLYEEMRKNPSLNLKKQIDALPFCSICTIDSFCSDIYRNYFAEAGLEPGLRVLDPEEAQSLFGEAADEVIEAKLWENNPRFINLLDKLTHKRSVANLKRDLLNIHGKLSSLLDSEKLLAINQQEFDRRAREFFISYYKKQLARIKEKGEVARQEAEAAQTNPKFIAHIDYLLDLTRTPLSFDSFSDFLKYDFELEFEKTPTKGGEWIDSFKKPLKGIYGELARITDACKKQTEEDGELLVAFLLLLRETREKYEQKKLARGFMDFADLSRFAARILEDGGRADRIADQYDYIFVDEYQDTSEVQEHIIGRIQKTGNLFMVGDIKQSIYGFRDAEPVIFINRRKQYESKKLGINIPMNANFRSDKDILDFVNAYFSPLMSQDFGGVDYATDSLLQPGLEMEDYGLPKVRIALFKSTEKEKREFPPVYSVAGDDCVSSEDMREAYFIAENIHSLVGKQYIYDAKAKQKRLIEYADIAILMRNRRDEGLFDALKQYSIPYASEKFEREKHFELDALINYLRLIDNFNNDIALAGVMKSFLGGFSHNELLIIRNAGKYKYFYESVLNYRGEDNIRRKIDEFLRVLRNFRSASYFKSVSDLLFEIMGTLGQDAYIMSKGGGEIEFINSFITNSRQKEYAASIPGFIKYYDQVFSEDISCCPKKENAVSVMTVHGSKGLEFPVVFLSHFELGCGKNRGGGNIYFDKDLGIGVKLFRDQTLEACHSFKTEAIKLKEMLREREEELRITYVALTRAKNLLFITGKDKECAGDYPDSSDNPVQWLKYSAQRNPALNALIEYPEECCSPPPMQEAGRSVPGGEEVDLSGLDFSYPHLEAGRSAQKYSVSKLNKYEPAEDGADYSLSEPYDIEAGNVYHKVLEHIDFRAIDSALIARELSNLQEGGILSAEEISKIDVCLVRDILSSALWDKIRAGKYFKEWAFMLYVPLKEGIKGSSVEDKALVQGVCDLVVLGEENLVVDYKVSGLDTQSIINRYQKQLELYSLAVQKIKKVPVHKKIIYVINRKEAIYLD